MQSFTFYNPVRLIAGCGTFSGLGREAAALGQRALIVTGRSAMRSAGFLDQAGALLAEAGVSYAVFDETPPNPTDDVVASGAEAARADNCDLVIGLGGGSAMDCAKAIAVAATHPQPIGEFLQDGEWGPKRVTTSATLPIVCVTTTSGTSSQLTAFAVITDRKTLVKNAVMGPAIFPKVAICDPLLAVGVPPRVTAATGIDVLCHAVEGFINTMAQPITETCAQRAIELVGAYLPRAVANGADIEAREMMSLADIFAGYSLSNAGATVMHALEHPISALHPQISHGEGLAALLPAYARLMCGRAPERFARFAELLGHTTSRPRLEDRAMLAEVAVAELLERIGLRVNLSGLGVERQALPRIVDDAMGYMMRGIAKMPGATTREDTMALLEASF